MNNSRRKPNTKGRRLRSVLLPRRVPRTLPLDLPPLRRVGLYPWLDAETNLIPRNRIQAYCDAIAQEFQPERIVLFGSYGSGQPTPDSDVDLFVIMPFRGRPAQQAFRIRSRFDTPFPLDLLIRRPEDVVARLREPDMFMVEVMTRGQVMYEAKHS